MTVFRETSAAEKRRELAAKMAELEQAELKEWEGRESTIGKIFGDALRSGKLSGDAFLKLITPLVTRKGDWKKLGIEPATDVSASEVKSSETSPSPDVPSSSPDNHENESLLPNRSTQ